MPSRGGVDVDRRATFAWRQGEKKADCAVVVNLPVEKQSARLSGMWTVSKVFFRHNPQLINTQNGKVPFRIFRIPGVYLVPLGCAFESR